MKAEEKITEKSLFLGDEIIGKVAHSSNYDKTRIKVIPHVRANEVQQFEPLHPLGKEYPHMTPAHGLGGDSNLYIFT